MAKSKRAAVDIPVPQSKEQAIEFIARIGEHQRTRSALESEMNDRIAAIKQETEAEAVPHLEAIRQLTEGLHIWSEAHRKELTNDGRTKTAKLATGEVRWRLTPYRVRIEREPEVISRIKAIGLQEFLRTKETINKEAMLESQEAREKAMLIEGVMITQKEEFVVVPFGTELEVVAL